MKDLKSGSSVRIQVRVMMLLCLASLVTMSNGMFVNSAQERSLSKRVNRSPEVSLAVDNSESPAVAIQVAGAKQISGHDYEQLTGSSQAAPRYISCPAIKVANTANQTVKAFALGIINKQTNSLDILRIGSHPLAAFEESVVTPEEWVAARKKTAKKFVHDRGVSREDKSSLGWSSEEMWLPGSIDDFYIFVGEVEFADGSSWFTKRTK